jgi:short subunit dehydrogenase-like uncharacterized protein
MSDISAKWMIYGATGYTGRMMVETAVADGMNPVLAGRNPVAVQALAEEYGLDWRSFELTDSEATREGIRGCRAVLHCAGPFSSTSQPMIKACLKEHVHYLDITGEIPVFANAHRQSDKASRRDVLLVPGVGFDVVPSDCLAARLVQILPAATHLTLGRSCRRRPTSPWHSMQVAGPAPELQKLPQRECQKVVVFVRTEN